jgi:hypothetical protein
VTSPNAAEVEVDENFYVTARNVAPEEHVPGAGAFLAPSARNPGGSGGTGAGARP